MGTADLDLLCQNITALHGDSFAADMMKESFNKTASAQLPANLKTELQALSLAAGKMVEILPRAEARWVTRALSQLIDEATPETPQQRWWEISLDTLSKTAKKLEQIGKSVGDSVDALRPSLVERFGPYGPVTLREISGENVIDICRLSDTLTEPRKNFVAQNAVSIAQGAYDDHAWMRAIYAGEAPVGFLMLYDDPEEPDYFLWRFMIAEPYHGRGFGRQAIERLVEHVKTRPGATELGVSCGQGEGSPEGFYQRLGFKPNGKKYGFEVGLSLSLLDG